MIDKKRYKSTDTSQPTAHTQTATSCAFVRQHQLPLPGWCCFEPSLAVRPPLCPQHLAYAHCNSTRRAGLLASLLAHRFLSTSQPATPTAMHPLPALPTAILHSVSTPPLPNYRYPTLPHSSSHPLPLPLPQSQHPSLMYVLPHPSSLPPPPLSFPLSPLFDVPGFPYPPPPATPYPAAAALPYDLTAYGQPLPPPPPPPSAFDYYHPGSDYSTAAAAMPPYGFYTQHQPAVPAASSTGLSFHSPPQTGHSPTPQPSSLSFQLPSTDLISTLPTSRSSSSQSQSQSPSHSCFHSSSHSSSRSSRSSISSRSPKRFVDTDAPVSTVAALDLSSPAHSFSHSSSTPSTPPYSAHHDRRSSAAVGTHTIDCQRATAAASNANANANSTMPTTPSGPTAVPMSPAHCPVKSEKSVEQGTDIQLPGLRVNVYMANSTHSPTSHSHSHSHSHSSTPSTTSPSLTHSPISLPSFTASTTSPSTSSPSSPSPSTPCSPISDELDAMDNAIDFQFAATGKPSRPIRHRKRRRKVSEISVMEVWRCANRPCDKIYKRTSSVSINRHKEVCEHRAITLGTLGDVSSKLSNASIFSLKEGTAGSNGAGSDVLTLIQQLLSVDGVSANAAGNISSSNGQNALSQLLNMATGGVSLEQLLTGALSEHLIRQLTAQLAPTPASNNTPAAQTAPPAATPAATSIPAAGRKRSYSSANGNGSASTGDLPALTRSTTTTPTSLASPHSAPPQAHKRITVTQLSENDIPSTPSPTSALNMHNFNLHSPHSAPPTPTYHHLYQQHQQQQQTPLPHSSYHARSHSASLNRQQYHTPQLIRGSFLGGAGGAGGLLAGLVGNDLVKAARVAGCGGEKMDAMAALSLKAAQVAMAQRELVANLFGHQHVTAMAIH